MPLNPPPPQPAPLEMKTHGTSGAEAQGLLVNQMTVICPLFLTFEKHSCSLAALEPSKNGACWDFNCLKGLAGIPTGINLRQIINMNNS